jgi:uncharacterized protein YunC (DUF1805 family)
MEDDVGTGAMLVEVYMIAEAVGVKVGDVVPEV